MQTNYHTHTKRCRHAFGEDEEYVKQAIGQGFDVLGFSDHSPWKYPSRYSTRVRMDLEEFPDYKASLENLKDKYKDQIRIMIGLEAEVFEPYLDWLLDFAIEQELDYLILGNHYIGIDYEGADWSGDISEEQLPDYIDLCIRGLKTGMYSYLCHPDLPMFSGRIQWNEKTEKEFERLCQAAKEMDIPLEYNCNGLMRSKVTGIEGYPHHKFWELAARTGSKAIIGMDSHMPKDLTRSLYDQGRKNLEDLHMEIIDEIPLVDFRKLKAEKEKADQMNQELKK